MRGRGHRADHRRAAAFTLLEILVVVVISGLVAAVAIPGFARAMQGAQIRTAARAMTMAHKYARNLAVLRQKPMALLVDTVAREIEVVALSERGQGGQQGFLDGRERRAEAALIGDKPAAEDGAAPEAPPDIASEFVRPLGKDITVEEFSSEDAAAASGYKGVYWVNYYPNGMSDGFRVKFKDPGGRSVVVVAEGISGSATVTFSR